jgi:hypothetical protein
MHRLVRDLEALGPDGITDRHKRLALGTYPPHRRDRPLLSRVLDQLAGATVRHPTGLAPKPSPCSWPSTLPPSTPAGDHKDQAAIFNITRDIRGEARLVERTFGLGASALAEAVQFVSERLEREAA